MSCTCGHEERKHRIDDFDVRHGCVRADCECSMYVPAAPHTQGGEAERYKPCDQIMVGSGSDTYDPICDLREGHDGPCKSTAAQDQHKLAVYPPGHPRAPVGARSSAVSRHSEQGAMEAALTERFADMLDEWERTKQMVGIRERAGRLVRVALAAHPSLDREEVFEVEPETPEHEKARVAYLKRCKAQFDADFVDRGEPTAEPWRLLAEHLHDAVAFMRSCELSGEAGADHSTVISALEAYEHRPLTAANTHRSEQ